jgi:hypothetical protein
MTRKTSGERLIQMRTHHGTRCLGERLERCVKQIFPCVVEDEKTTDYIACFHVSPSNEFTAAAILNTREENQNTLTASAKAVPVHYPILSHMQEGYQGDLVTDNPYLRSDMKTAASLP